MIGQREFKEVLFKNGLPWVFVFNGLPGGPAGNRKASLAGASGAGRPDLDDSTMVIVGDLAKTYQRSRCLFRSVHVGEDARMEIPAADGRFIMYDFYGNPLPSRNGGIAVPLNGLGYFLRTDGSPGSFAKNYVAAVQAARISGIDPVEIQDGRHDGADWRPAAPRRSS